MGNRGKRAREEDGARARRLAAGLLVAAVALAGTGFLLASPAARLASAVPPLLAAGIALLVRLEVERTLAGEIAVAVALSSAGFPVAIASGVAPATSAAAWLAWSLGFAATTLAVEVVLTRARSPARDPGAAAAAARRSSSREPPWRSPRPGWSPGPCPLAVAPLALASLAVIWLRVPARRLRVVGWAALAGSTAALVVLLVGLR